MGIKSNVNLGMVNIKCARGCNVGYSTISLNTDLSGGRFTASGEGVTLATVHMRQMMIDPVGYNFADDDGPLDESHSTFKCEGNGGQISFSLVQLEKEMVATVIETSFARIEGQSLFKRR